MARRRPAGDDQLALPLRRSGPVTDREVIVVGARSFPLRLVRHHRARHYILRVEADGTARVTIPRWGSGAGARRFARQHVAWIRQQQYQHTREARVPRVWRSGTRVLLRGEWVTLGVGGGPDRPIVTLGDERLPLSARSPDAPADLRPLVERRLRALAVAELPSRVHQLAADHGLAVGRVQVRNQRSHWGSCSSGGTIALNWRLVQMPPWVSDYVVLHELMHLREPNHSRGFWYLVARVCPGHQEARAWLKAHQEALR